MSDRSIGHVAGTHTAPEAANPITPIRQVYLVAPRVALSPVAKVISCIFRIMGCWAARSNQVSACPITQPALSAEADAAGPPPLTGGIAK